MVLNNEALKVANQMPVITQQQQQQPRATQMYGLQGSGPMEVSLESEFSFPGVDQSDNVQQQQQQQLYVREPPVVWFHGVVAKSVKPPSHSGHPPLPPFLYSPFRVL